MALAGLVALRIARLGCRPSGDDGEPGGDFTHRDARTRGGDAFQSQDRRSACTVGVEREFEKPLLNFMQWRAGL